MLSHFVGYTNKYGKGAQKREEEIEAEVMRQLQLARAQDALGRKRRLDDEPLEGADVYELDNFERARIAAERRWGTSGPRDR